MGEKRRLLRVLVRFIVSSSSIPLSVDFKTSHKSSFLNLSKIYYPDELTKTVSTP
jgi:hypothetical protein